MKPLVVTFDHSFKLSPDAEWNLMEIPRKLDCDHLRFTLSNGIRNALCRSGSEANGDFYRVVQRSHFTTSHILKTTICLNPIPFMTEDFGNLSTILIRILINSILN